MKSTAKIAKTASSALDSASSAARKTNAARKANVRLAAAIVLASVLLCSLPSLAYASEKEGIAVILPDMLEFIPMLVAFIIVAIVLVKFGWPVVNNIIEKREAIIKDELEKSEAARIESERVLAEYKQLLEDSKAQSAQIIADAKTTAEAVKADITAKAQAEANAMIEKAKGAIEAEKKAAIAELQSSLADTSIAVASRLVSQDLDDEVHRAIVERYVSEAGSFNAN